MIRKARLADVATVAQVINGRAALGELLPRSQHHIYQNLRDFVVYERESQILGAGAMHVLWRDLGEIRALAVAGPWQGQGIGTAIVQALLREATSLGLERAFAFTYKPRFFERLGFYLVDKETLPRKVWGECIHCVKFPVCDEVAMVFDLDQAVLSSRYSEPGRNTGDSWRRVG
jgi:amino-acid N-acetyltransferase